MIIGLVGPIASGKGEAVRILTEAGFAPYSLSSEVRKEVSQRRLALKREVLVEVGNEMRTGEPAYFARKTAEQILADGVSLAVVDGIRNPAEAAYLKQELNMVLLAISAPQEQRLARYLARHREDDGSSEADFSRQDRQDLGEGEASHGQQVAECIAIADVTLANDADLETFQNKLKALISQL
jgi:dephospho-CoA kinase